jgi:hypothetical protein
MFGPAVRDHGQEHHVSDETVETEEPQPAAPIPDMSDDEITTVARDWVIGQIYMPPDIESARMSFMILMLCDPRQLPDNIGWVYEYLHKANPMAVNGLPTFFSCRFINHDDWPKVIDKAHELEAVIFPERVAAREAEEAAAADNG